MPEAIARLRALETSRTDGVACFARLYREVTEGVGAELTAGRFASSAFLERLDVRFAGLFFSALDAFEGDPRSAPRAWVPLFAQRARRGVAPLQFALAGMNAHINRDLPYVVASVGLVAPDGSSRKPDYDKVESFLAAAAEAMLAENAQRFDPSMDDAQDPADAAYTLVMQLVSVGRENAWRNAEALVSAPTPEARALVEARIESDANATARAILLGQAYLPPLTSPATRDAYCQAHNGDPAPVPYPFGTPSPYRT